MDNQTQTQSAQDDVVRARVSKELKQRFTQTALEQGRKPTEALRQAMVEWVQRARQAA